MWLIVKQMKKKIIHESESELKKQIGKTSNNEKLEMKNNIHT